MIASNADDYAATRQNFFFPAHNTTPVDGNLTGQCVTLLKWFFAEMCDGFPSPFAARGDARYVGQTLVRNGLAIEVPYDQRRRGDVVCYEYGTYGHIALQLSGGRVFEENVNMPGTTRRFVDGAYVYSSRIASENEAWRAGKNPHIYRLRNYIEPGQGGNNMAGIPNAPNWKWRFNKLMDQIRGRVLGDGEFEKNFVGVEPFHMVEILSDSLEADQALADQKLGQLARTDNWQGQIYGLLDQLKGRPTPEELAAAVKQAQDLQASVQAAQSEAAAAKEQAAADREKAKELELEKIEAEKTGGLFMRWIGDLLNKLKGNG